MKKDSLIKILSLALGLAIGLVLTTKIFFELSYDSSYQDSDRIHLILSGFTRGEESFDFLPQVSGGVAPGFKDAVPGVESATRLTSVTSSNNFKDSEGNIITGDNFAADNCFFDVFSQEILVGDPKEVLENPDQVMVSESFAKKLGGINEAIGKTITPENAPESNKTIGGVFRDFKKNGGIHPDVIFSLNVINERSRLNWIGNDRYQGYVKLEKGVDPSSLSDAIHKMQETHQNLQELEQMGVKIWYTLQSLPSIHKNQSKVKTAIIILAIMTFLLIAISLMNYVLIAISGIVKRSREIGVRKCYGADKKAIFYLLLKETTLEIFIALALGSLLIFVGRNLIEDYTGYSFSDLMVRQSIMAMIIIFVLVFVISVLVPSRLFIKLPIGTALRGFKETSRKWKLALLSTQIAINVFMVCFVIIISLQYKKVNNFYPGYNTENIVYVSYYNDNPETYQRVSQSLKNLPFVIETGLSASLPFKGSSGNDTWLPESEIDRFNVADLYPSTMEVFDIFNPKFIEGRKPRNKDEIAVSKSYVDKMNNFTDWSEGSIGRQIMLSGHNDLPFTITGVYEDILIGNLLESDRRPSVWPIGTWDSEIYVNYLLIKTTDINPSIISQINDTLNTVVENRELEAMVYSEGIKASYDESRKIRDVLMIGGSFSLLIALMGLIGFLNDESTRRTKELAIRKINGASSKDLFSIFYSSIIKLSLGSALIAVAGAFILGRHWLTQFSEKIQLSWTIFISGTLIILIIVSAVVLANCYRVVTSNPTKSLQTE